MYDKHVIKNITYGVFPEILEDNNQCLKWQIILIL